MKYAYVLLPLVFAGPILGAQQKTDLFRPISPPATTLSISQVLAKSPQATEMLRLRQQSPTVFNCAELQASPTTCCLAYQALVDVQKYLKKSVVDPVDVLIFKSKATSANQRTFSFKCTPSDDGEIKRTMYRINIDEDGLLAESFGALRMALYHEVAHIVIPEHLALTRGCRDYYAQACEHELEADEVAARASACYHCVIDEAVSFHQLKRLPDFRHCTLDKIKTFSDKEFKEHIEALIKLRPRNAEHPLDLERCLRFIQLAKQIKTLCPYHHVAAQSSPPARKGQKRPAERVDDSPSRTKKLKVQKKEGN